MLGYGNHALTRRIVDRIFDSKPRPYGSSKHRDFMTYEHFVFFYLAEKDKSSPISQRYWFRLLDLDQDGAIDVQDMEYFFEEQQDRMDSLGHDIVLFEDMLCQITDMIRPTREGRFTTKICYESILDVLRYFSTCSSILKPFFNSSNAIHFWSDNTVSRARD